ncbi:DUF4286 family protein [Microbacterium rhizophilus]|uniref:DUF4286 family protein n=1 Tax=Microbacterium rhizophilus TaxID=3138934 RepID=UPI0031E8190D
MTDEKRPGLLMVQMEIAAEHEDELNAWYWEEHVPERLACPGFRSARRFRLESSNAETPKYLALYELDDVSALETPEYKRALAESTPRTKNIGRLATITRSEFVELFDAA